MWRGSLSAAGAKAQAPAVTRYMGTGCLLYEPEKENTVRALAASRTAANTVNEALLLAERIDLNKST
jgi:hypothetical protein